MLLRPINPFSGKNTPPVNNPPSLANRVTHFCYDVFEAMCKCLASLPLVGRFAPVPVVVVTQKPSMKDSVCRVAHNAIQASTQFVSAHKKAIACGLVLTGLATASYVIGTDSIQVALKQSLDSLSTLYYGTPASESAPSSGILSILGVGGLIATALAVSHKVASLSNKPIPLPLPTDGQQPEAPTQAPAPVDPTDGQPPVDPTENSVA